MPVHRCKKNGKLGYKWGQSGKCYVGFGARAKAEKQAQAIYASGYAGNALTINKRRRKPNPLRADPSRTATIRRKFEAEVKRRFNQLRTAVRDLLLKDDAFGLKDPTSNAFCPTGPGGGIDPSCSPGGASAVDDSKAILPKPPEHWQEYALGAIGKSMKDFQMKLVTVASVKPTQSRQDYINDSSKHLAKQMKEVEKGGADEINRAADYYPIVVDKHGKILDGNHRHAAHTINKYKYIWAMVEKEKRADNANKDDPILTGNERFEFMSRPEQVEAFEKWLASQTKYYILGMTQEQIKRSWWEQYVQEGYMKGAGRAFQDTRRFANKNKMLSWYGGTEEDFLRSSFGRPVAIEKVQLLASRTFMDLKNATEQMATVLRRDLTDGLVQGQNPWEIARTLDKNIEGIGKQRAMTIARTEIIRAHAEGNLDAMEQLGVEDVGVMVEWSTAGDDRVCDLCAPLEGVVFKLDELRGMIPRHPQCVVGESRIICDDALSVIKSHYTGEIVEVLTSVGRRLSVTANHVLLTEFGFLPAQCCYKGLKLLSTPYGDALSLKAPDEHAAIPGISDVFTTLSKLRVMLNARVPCAGADLHGDGKSCNGEVHVVFPNGNLWSESETSAHPVNFCLPSFKFTKVGALLSELSTSAQVLKRLALSADSSETALRDVLSLLLGHLLVAQVDGFTWASRPEASHFKSLYNHVTANAELFSKCKDALPFLKHAGDLIDRQLEAWAATGDGDVVAVSGPQVNTGRLELPGHPVIPKLYSPSDFGRSYSGLIEFDEVCGVRVRHAVDLPVFDVSTYSTLYQIEGILSSNCRCTPIPANVGEDQGGQTRGQKAVEKAIDASIDAGGLGRERTPWVGADKDISKDRPQAIVKEK